ncbi:hypothetical protein BDR03DRAFT_961019 [Suillus americanus]|nr:hypothetical protein BDR03DRAFT_961019 [Suillus americanus]
MKTSSAGKLAVIRKRFRTALSSLLMQEVCRCKLSSRLSPIRPGNLLHISFYLILPIILVHTFAHVDARTFAHADALQAATSFQRRFPHLEASLCGSYNLGSEVHFAASLSLLLPWELQLA